MLKIKVSGIWLDLDLNLAITLTLNNPIFDSESIERTYSYPFRIPLTAHNQTVFNNTERLDVDVNNDEYPAEMYLNGLLIESGIIKITSYDFAPVNRSFLKVVFQNKARNLGQQLSKLKINELLETIEIAQTEHSQYVLFAPNFGLLNIQINGVSVFQSPIGSQNIEELLEKFVIEFSSVIDDFFISFDPEEQTVTIANPNSLNFYLNIIQGFTLIESTTPAKAKQLNMLNYMSEVINNPSPSHSFVTMYNRLFYESENDGWLGFINFWRNGKTIENEDEEELIWKHTIVPFVRLPYVFNRIFSNLEGFGTIFGSLYDSIDVQQAILYNNYALDEVIQYQNLTVSDSTVYMNAYKSRIDLNDHILNITAQDLFSAFAELTCTYYRIVGNDVEVVRKVDQLRQTPLNWTSKAEPAYSGKNELNQGVTLDYQQDEDDTYDNTAQLEPAVIGLGEIDINTTISSVHDITQFVKLNEYKFHFGWKIPVVRQSGSSDETGKSPYTLRLLFDRGLQSDSEGQLYPFGTHSDINYEGNQVGDLSLDWNAPQGLLTKLWEEFTDTIDKDEVTMTMRLNVTDILTIKRWENARVIIQHPKGTLNGIIKSVQAKITVTSGLVFSKVTLLKVA